MRSRGKFEILGTKQRLEATGLLSIFLNNFSYLCALGGKMVSHLIPYNF